MRTLRYIAIAFMLGGSSLIALTAGADAQVSVGISVNIAPPALPVYTQPPLPAPGYIWTPGYWAWSGVDYYWVPGTWAQAPSPGLLWTPGYWGWNDGAYVFNAGYWGPHVGFYGGISYGFGYTGVGFQGGYWNHGSYFYNSSVNNVSNVHVTNVYNKTVINNTTNNVSYNGGTGGTAAKPTEEELATAKEPHVAPTHLQVQHQQAASKNPALFASKNHGNPAIAATSHPGVFKGPGVVRAGKGANPENATKPAATTTPHKEMMEKKVDGAPSTPGPKANVEKPVVAPKVHAEKRAAPPHIPHAPPPRRAPPPHQGKNRPH